MKCALASPRQSWNAGCVKLIHQFVYAYLNTSGWAAMRRGEYTRALEYFDRAACRRKPTPVLNGYRAMALMLDGQKEASRAAFRELAAAAKSDNPNDEYARLYARMYVAYIDNDLAEADRMAVEMEGIPCLRSVKSILIPISRPSELATDAPYDADAGLDVQQIKAHFEGLQGAYPIRKTGA